MLRKEGQTIFFWTGGGGAIPIVHNCISSLRLRPCHWRDTDFRFLLSVTLAHCQVYCPWRNYCPTLGWVSQAMLGSKLTPLATPSFNIVGTQYPLKLGRLTELLSHIALPSLNACVWSPSYPNIKWRGERGDENLVRVWDQTGDSKVGQ